MKIAKIQSGFERKFFVRKSGKNVNLMEILSKKFSDDFSRNIVKIRSEHGCKFCVRKSGKKCKPDRVRVKKVFR